ncbi:hypothetical protein QJS10_CPB13g00989 [Acorus calamus]|uniref:Uncharacterized protein n=1 Tax=Acorus calamus TaxID=4465 RepID=A0AAV9DIT9_ACOCL|nr:hypothetical protein QJS10_CPB13g00989 [Acorus calamus]
MVTKGGGRAVGGGLRDGGGGAHVEAGVAMHARGGGGEAEHETGMSGLDHCMIFDEYFVSYVTTSSNQGFLHSSVVESLLSMGR